MRGVWGTYVHPPWEPYAYFVATFECLGCAWPIVVAQYEHHRPCPVCGGWLRRFVELEF